MRSNDTDDPYLLCIFTAWLGCLSMTVVFNSVVGKIGFLAYIGRHSMMFYVIHWLPLYISKPIILQVNPDITSAELSVALAAIEVITLSIISCQRKRIPAWWLGEGAITKK